MKLRKILNVAQFNTKVIDVGLLKLNVKLGKALNSGTLGKGSTAVAHGISCLL
jgi:hypothetical protein